ncbi:O-antigen ligase family protein, partial [Vibrio anguillarum]|nr:O-antigen ligase family protein [Vibrio anguillarum]
MQISYKNFISGLLFVFLLNSAGVFSPSLAVRDSDFVSEIEISSNMVNRLIMLSSFMISIVFLFKNNKDFFKIIIIKAWPLW